MAKNMGRHIAHFAAGGDAISGTAQGMPAPTAGGGFTPGPETNAAGSWGAGAQSGGIAGDTNASPVGAPDTSAFNQPGDYVAPAAALPAAAADTPHYVAPPPVAQAAPMWGGGGGQYGARVGGMKDGGTVQSMKRGGKVRQPKPNGKPGSSQPTNEPPTNEPPTNEFPQAQAPQAPRAPQAPQAPMSGIPAGPSPPMGMDEGGDVPDTSVMPMDAEQGQEGQAGDPAPQKSGPSPAVQSALTAARAQFGLNDNMFNMMSKQTAGNMPTKPAGPGGDQPTSNPFPTKNPATPFGTKTSQADSDGDSDTVSAASGGSIYPKNKPMYPTIKKVKTPPGFEDSDTGAPPIPPQMSQGAQAPPQQSDVPDVASADGGGAIPEEWSTKVPQMGDRAKRKKT